MIRGWVVRGRVQGVGYRYFVTRQAERLGLGGFARNLPDGSVEVVARGGVEELDRLEAALRRGPFMSRVATVEKRDIQHEIDLPKSFLSM